MKILRVFVVGFLVICAVVSGSYAQSKFEAIHSFDDADGSEPSCGVLIVDDVLYGVTRYGGTSDDGVIYRMKPDGSDHQVLYNFLDNDQGRNPQAGLVMFSNLLYGLTQYGGTNNDGVIFSIAPDGADYTARYMFGTHTTNDGRSPRGRLTAYQDRLYGMTYYGGTNDEGVLFSYNPGSSAYAVHHVFGSLDGENPHGDLLVEDDALYGMTLRGGAENYGVVFSMDINSENYTVLHDFGSIPGDGERPYGSLISDGSRLYGLTSSGGTSVFYYYMAAGTVFAIDSDGSDYAKLHDFEWMSEGFSPNGSLVSDGTTLYGVTTYGGGTGIWGYYGGSIFALGTDGEAFNTIHSFSIDKMEEGISPDGDLVLYNNAFYGVTLYGGVDDGGVLFSFMPQMACLNDFDGDGRTDLDVFRPYSGMWYIDQSREQNILTRQWGWNESQPFTGDFDGDGKYDTAFYWPQQGMWYIWQSRDGIRVVQWGWPESVPVPGDYDGDLKTDIAVYDPRVGNWYILLSGSGQLRMQNWGWSSAIPVPGDYDGDRKTDLCIYWPQGGNWYVLYSGGGGLIRNWGWAQAQPLAGDFDGDNKADLAVYAAQNNGWSILYSGGGSCFTNMGTTTSIPVPADYDGDDKTDLAMLEPATGMWTIYNSDNGTMRTDQLGYSETPPAMPQYWINRWFGE